MRDDGSPAREKAPFGGRPSLWLGILVLAFWGMVVSAGAQEIVWRELEPGLEMAVLANATDVVAARIDPARFKLELLSVKEQGGEPRTIEDWAREFGLSAAINAGMFLEDQRTSAGYMKSSRVVNNPGFNPRYGAFFVFGPKAAGLPEVRFVDRYHHDWRKLIAQYHVVVQNFRMIGAAGENTWRPDGGAHSIACVGVDAGGWVLFIHSRAPRTVHDFVELLRAQSLDVQGLMYVEGGPPACLYVKAGDVDAVYWGVGGLPGAGLMGRRLPNVLGVRRNEEGAGSSPPAAPTKP
jgi:uncharacterized protein YigE (DUF2233 family)